MPKKNKTSIFQQYFLPGPFVDRFKKNPHQAVDVLMPVVHTNELWAANLLSIYREIPVNRLLIGDGGCLDDSIKIARKFPRVKVFNHRKFISLGYSIKKLIEAVETDWFVYLHSDVYLPDGWFAAMKKNQKKYDWFECRQRMTVLVDYLINYPPHARALSGSQMGRKAAFKNILPVIEDDYLYRNEDLIYAELIKEKGFKYGRADDTFHYHQLMNKPSKWQREIKSISLDIKKGTEEENREWLMQIKGIIKYTNPTNIHLIQSVQGSLSELKKMKEFDFENFQKWVGEVNSRWLPYIAPTMDYSLKDRLKQWLRMYFHKLL